MATKQQSPRLGDLDLLVFDFDGVMTDNRVLVFSDGLEAVFCNRGDGLGIDMLREAGLRMAILSTETDSVVAARARKLRLPVRHGLPDKALALSQILADDGIDPSRTAFVGNDLNDLGAMGLIGWPLCPRDAHPAVLGVCVWVIPADGGGGVVRRLADELLRA